MLKNTGDVSPGFLLTGSGQLTGSPLASITSSAGIVLNSFQFLSFAWKVTPVTPPPSGALPHAALRVKYPELPAGNSFEVNFLPAETWPSSGEVSLLVVGAAG